ncbi:MAG: hypothetical protein QME75_12360 [Deltaproteobacteria bacterium]|nr:hypothetical protein [Deltaproteobacteria bacterium]
MAPWLVAPDNLILQVALLFGAGLGFGSATGKGWLLIQRLRNGSVPPQQRTSFCQDILCREHSGLVADIKHLVRGNEEIKGALDQLWGAVNELRKEVRAYEQRT